MPHSRIVVIGASAGGFDAVRAVLAVRAGLRPPAPPQLPAVTCPSCGGAASEADEEGVARDERHVGARARKAAASRSRG